MPDPTDREMLDIIERVLEIRSGRRALLSARRSRGRLFESYVFALLYESASMAGMKPVVMAPPATPNPRVIVLRAGNGRLASSSRPYAYIQVECHKSRRKLEVHLGVTYTGASRADHEVDISVIDHRKASVVRASRSSTAKATMLHSAYECKCYDKPPGLCLARQFAGVLTDCPGDTKAQFVTNADETESLRRFIRHRKGSDVTASLSPLRPSEANFITATASQMRKWR